MSKVKQVKVALLALVAALVIAIPTSAFAAGDTVTIKDSNGSNDKSLTAGHMYEAYQVFDGTVSTSGDVLSNPVWGAGVNGGNIVAAINNSTDTNVAPLKQAIGSKTGDAAAAALVEYLSTITTAASPAQDNETLKAFADIVAQNVKASTNPTMPVSIAAGTAATIADPGYYLIKDADDTVAGSETAATRIILGLYGGKDVQVDVKSDVPKVDKFVKEDTTNQHGTKKVGEENAWGKIGDYEVGQVFEYQLVGTLPTNYADYETYWYKFTDTLSEGQTYHGNLKIYVDGKKVSTGYEAVEPKTDKDTKGGTLTVTFANLNKLKDDNGAAITVSADSIITVEYEAVLNAYAVKGNDGNENKVYLEFSNNPNKGHDGDKETGKTPEKYTVVFTYDLNDTKIKKDDANTKLDGATFILMNSAKKKVYAGIKDDGTVNWLDYDASKDYTIEPYAQTTASGGKFSFTGLDADTYYLKEIKAPDEYNMPADPYFEVKITATFEETYDGNTNPIDGDTTSGKLTKLEVTGGTGNVETGAVAQNIENTQGTTLPSTGGIGTTIFYVVGGTLVLVALIAMVVRRRRSATTA